MHSEIESFRDSCASGRSAYLHRISGPSGSWWPHWLRPSSHSIWLDFTSQWFWTSSTEEWWESLCLSGHLQLKKLPSPHLYLYTILFDDAFKCTVFSSLESNPGVFPPRFRSCAKVSVQHHTQVQTKCWRTSEQETQPWINCGLKVIWFWLNMAVMSETTMFCFGFQSFLVELRIWATRHKLSQRTELLCICTSEQKEKVNTGSGAQTL